MRISSADRGTKPTYGSARLAPGERMTQPEFHRRYEAYPDKRAKFELIGGVVFMASPLRYPHGRYDQTLSLVFGFYAAATPGVETASNATVILGETSEPQPDLTLRLTQAAGGQSRINAREYVEGAPELLAEVAYSSRDIDLHAKRDDYRQAGVREYLVVCVEERELHWFDFTQGTTLRPNRAGVCRSRIFPGLWLDVQALLDQNAPRLIEVVQQGLASRPHAAFVRRLERARRKQEM